MSKEFEKHVEIVILMPTFEKTYILAITLEPDRKTCLLRSPLHFFILTGNILRKTLEHHNEVFAVAEKSLSTDIKR